MYLDPAFGGMLVQIILAIVAAGGATAFALRKKIRKLFSKNKTDNNINQTIQKKNVDDEDIIDTLSE